MKKINLLLPALAAGAAGMVLRLALYRTGFDDRGLLIPGNPLHSLCWLLAIALGVFLLLRLRGDGSGLTLPRELRIFSAAAAAALLAFCAGDYVRDAQGGLQWARALFCALLAAATALEALAGIRRRAIHPALHTPACLFFAVDMLCRYQNWSGNPQLADYCFALAASVCLCLAAYHRLALPAGLGKPKAHLLFTLMGLCLCLYSLVGPEGGAFYLAGAFWILTGPDTIPGKEKTDVPS